MHSKNMVEAAFPKELFRSSVSFVRGLLSAHYVSFIVFRIGIAINAVIARTLKEKSKPN